MGEGMADGPQDRPKIAPEDNRRDRTDQGDRRDEDGRRDDDRRGTGKAIDWNGLEQRANERRDTERRSRERRQLERRYAERRNIDDIIDAGWPALNKD